MKRQKRVRFGFPAIGREELSAVRLTLAGRRLTMGGQVLSFEERFQNACGGGIAVAVSSGMSALFLTWKALGLKGSVVVPALTHAATVHAVELNGLRPVFCDADPATGNMEPGLIEMTDDIVGFAPVHFLGAPSFMMSIASLARERGLAIVEDCALAIGQTHSGRHVGLIGDAGCFSFHPVKQMTTAEGGMVLTKHAGLAAKLRALRSFGYGADAYGDIEEPGFNFRMSEVHAAIGNAQLARLPSFLSRRRENASHLRTMLDGFRTVGSDYAISVFVPKGYDRDRTRHAMLVSKVETSVYYPRPVPDFTYYREKYGPVDCPVARDFSRNTIALPVGPHLDREHMAQVARIFRKALVKCA